MALRNSLWMPFVFISALCVAATAQATAQSTKAPASQSDCSKLIRMHGFLSRSQFQCSFSEYSELLTNLVRECSRTMPEARARQLLKEGMQTFDRNAKKLGMQLLCRDIARDFAEFIASPEIPELAALEDQVRSALDRGAIEAAMPLATRLVDRALALTGPDHKAYAGALHALGVIQMEAGQSQDAIKTFRTALPLAEKLWGPSSFKVGELLHNLGEALFRLGEPSNSEILLRRALEIHRSNDGSDSVRVAETQLSLANALATQSKHKEAQSLYFHSIAVFRKHGGDKDWRMALVYMNLGNSQRDEGNVSEAEKSYLFALGVQAATLGKTDLRYARTLKTLAQFYFDTKEYGSAQNKYEEALPILVSSLGPDHYQIASLYSRLASIALVRPFYEGQVNAFFEGVKKYLALRTKAATIAKRYDPLILRDALSRSEGSADVRHVRARHLVALDMAKHVHHLIPSASKEAIDSDSFEIGQALSETSIGAAVQQMAARIASTEPRLARMLDQQEEALSAWRVLDRQLTEGLLGNNQTALHEHSAKLAELEQIIIKRSARIQREFPNYAALTNVSPMTVEEVQSLLRGDEALVVFSTDDLFLSVWVVTKNELRWVSNSARADSINRPKDGAATFGTKRNELWDGEAKFYEEKFGHYWKFEIKNIRESVLALRCGLDASVWKGSGVEACSRALGIPVAKAPRPSEALPFDHYRAHALYTILFDQVEDLIRGKHLLIVASGPLTQLPFQVLVTKPPISSDHRAIAWLGREHATTVLPAVSSLKALRRVAVPSAADRPMIGFGNPLLDGAGARYPRAELAREKQRCPEESKQLAPALLDAREALTGVEIRGGLANIATIKRIDPLPETADEVCDVARALKADVTRDIFLGARATERQLKELSASGELAKYRVVYFATHGVLPGRLDGNQEPGLILTPPEKATEKDDGYLSASEIANLKLDADWVILSACNTAGAADSSAEALSGLARAFIHAQARALLVSHWEVYSGTTVRLIKGAVREMAEDAQVGGAEALRRSMLAILDKGEPHEAHPAYWAPFVVVGDGAAGR